MGQDDFNRYYTALYGERWPALKHALEEPVRAVALAAGLVKPYFLDEGSAEAAHALGVRPGDAVLDLCAAPGGKTLLLCLAAGSAGRIVANDRSSSRRARLRRVIAEHLPQPLSARVTITAHDASRWGLHEQDVYDRVLADVPCSSERHVLSSPAHLAQWSPARPRNLARQAFAILAAAFTAVKPGGIVVYSTCALSPAENDDVVSRLLERRPAALLSPVADSPDAATGERTGTGRIILPDRARGAGPIFYSVIRKRADVDAGS